MDQAVFFLDVDLLGDAARLNAWLRSPDPQGLSATSTYRYQWQWWNGSVWADLPGATSAAYTPGTTPGIADDVDLRVRVQYTDGAGTAETTESVASTAAQRQIAADFTLSAWPVEDSPVSVKLAPGASAPATTLSYQWQRQDSNGAWLDVANATNSGYTPSDIDVEQLLRVRVRYSAGTGLTQSVYAQAAGPVNNINDAPVSLLKISGSLTQGQKLALTGTLTDADLGGTVPANQLTVQWWASTASGFEQLDPQGLELTLTEALVGRTVQARVSYVDRWSFEEVLMVPASGPVANVNDAPTGAVTLEGFLEQYSLLEVGWEVSDPDGPDAVPRERVQWQWFANGQPIAGATTDRLALAQAQVGTSITVRGRYLDDRGGWNELSSVASAPVSDVPDEPSGSLLIRVRDAQGQPIDAPWRQGLTLMLVDTLADLDGSPASGAGAKRYEWLLDGQVLAQGPTLTLTQQHLGAWNGSPEGSGDALISARVWYTSPRAGALPEAHEAGNPGFALDANDAPVGGIVVKGKLGEGETLVASPAFTDADGFDPSAIVWSWLADGAPIAGASEGALELGSAVVNKTVSVRATYLDNFGGSNTVTTPVGVVINRPDVVQGEVWINPWRDGQSPVQGMTLSVGHSLTDPDGMPNGSAIQWRWVDWNGSVVGTGASLMLTQSVVGRVLRAEARFTDLNGGSEFAASDWMEAVGNTNDAPVSALRIDGTAQQGQTVALAGSVSDPDLATALTPKLLSVQWQAARGDAPFEDIDAQGATLTIAEALVGQSLRARVSYVDAWDYEEVLYVTLAGKVLGLNDAPQGILAIEGSAEQHNELQIAWDVFDADSAAPIARDTVLWQWLADGQPIAGAQHDSLLLTQALVGRAISVRARYQDDQAYWNELTSAPTLPVGNVPDDPIGSLQIRVRNAAGQPVSEDWQEGATLMLVDTLVDPDGIPASGQGAKRYEWLLDGLVVGQGPTFTIEHSHLGDWSGTGAWGNTVLSARVWYTDQQAGSGPEAHESDNRGFLMNVNDPPQSSLSIAGALQAGAVLTVTGALVDGDLSASLPASALSVQWQSAATASGTFADLPGETGLSIALSETLVGQRIRAQVSFRDDWGTLESLNIGTLLNRPHDASGTVVHWRTHAPLDGVTVEVKTAPTASPRQILTGVDPDAPGGFQFSDIDFDAMPALMMRASTTAPAPARITAADALAAFKLALGRNPNVDSDGAGPLPGPLSETAQHRAADVNLDGQITVDDARAIASHVLDALAQSTPSAAPTPASGTTPPPSPIGEWRFMLANDAALAGPLGSNDWTSLNSDYTAVSGPYHWLGYVLGDVTG